MYLHALSLYRPTGSVLLPQTSPPPFCWTSLTRSCHHVALGSHLGPNGLMFFNLLRVSPLVGSPPSTKLHIDLVSKLEDWGIEKPVNFRVSFNPGQPPEKLTNKRRCDYVSVMKTNKIEVHHQPRNFSRLPHDHLRRTYVTLYFKSFKKLAVCLSSNRVFLCQCIYLQSVETTFNQTWDESKQG